MNHLLYTLVHDVIKPLRPVTEQPLFYLALLAVILGFQLFLAGFICEMVSRNGVERNRYNIKDEL